MVISLLFCLVLNHKNVFIHYSHRYFHLGKIIINTILKISKSRIMMFFLIYINNIIKIFLLNIYLIIF